MQSRSRRKKGARPRRFAITPLESLDGEVEMVEADQLPPLFIWPKFEPARFLTGKPPSSGFGSVRAVITTTGSDTPSDQLREGTIKTNIDFTYLMRLAAKIAHGFIFTRSDFSAFEPLLRNVILTGNNASFFVGCPEDLSEYRQHVEQEGGKHGHIVSLDVVSFEDDAIHQYLLATIQLFTDVAGPIFQVIAARRRMPGAAILANDQAIELPADLPNELPLRRLRLVVTVSKTKSDRRVKVGESITSDAIDMSVFETQKATG